MPAVRWNHRRVAIVVIAMVTLLFLLLTFLLRTEEETVTTNGKIPVHKHKLAVIVPFRDRFEELMVFVPHLHSFLKNSSIEHKIYIINQADKLRFNRAALINIGYKMSVLECDYLAMHDVDLLPVNPLLDYSFPTNYVYHLASPQLHPLYHYKTFVGGILLLSHDHFEKLNGLSNRYWGWGREDDEFYVRIKEADIPIKRPDVEKITTGYNTFKHIHDRIRRPRDNRRYGDQKKAGSRRDRFTGLRTVEYSLTEMYSLTIDDAPVTVYNVELGCDKTDTPWCENPSHSN